MTNPYEAPRSASNPTNAGTAQDPTPDSHGPVYSIGQIGGGAFFGGPLTGLWLMARNAQKLGQHELHRSILWVSCVVIPVFLVLVFFGPDKMPNIVYSLTSLFAVRAYADKVMGGAVAQRMTNPDNRISNWRVFGWVLATAPVTIAVMLVMFFGIGFALDLLGIMDLDAWLELAE